MDLTIVDDSPNDFITLTDAESSRKITESDGLFKKHESELIAAATGILISFTRVPDMKKQPTSLKREPLAISIDVINRQLQNDSRPITSIDFGRNIVVSPDPKKDFFSTTRRCESSEIFISQSDSHSEKLFEQISSTESGIENRLSPLP
jgi:hypothetical protein